MNLLKTFTPIGLGTWNMERNPQGSVEALRAGIEAGANHIDTAEMYGQGRVEEIVGKAVKGIRDQVFVVSKVLASNARYKDVLVACERSLKHLQMEYLDSYLLHWRDRHIPLEETFRAFEKLTADGKIKSWGVSNFNVSDMEEATKLVGEEKIVCNQVYYSIAERAVESKLLPWCRAHHVTLVSYSPLGQGRLADNSALNQVARELKATSAQIALAFLIRRGDVITIPKSSDVQRTRENIQAMQIALTEDQVRRLEEAFPLIPRGRLPTV